MEKGKQVKKGDVLFVRSDPALSLPLKESEEDLTQMEKDLAEQQAQTGNMRIMAPASGSLTLANNVGLGSTIQQSSKLGTVSDNSAFTTTLSFSAEEASDLRSGDAVDITVDNYALTKAGTITSLDPTLYAGMRRATG
jgi:HlyD family secretion protein